MSNVIFHGPGQPSLLCYSNLVNSNEIREGRICYTPHLNSWPSQKSPEIYQDISERLESSFNFYFTSKGVLKDLLISDIKTGEILTLNINIDGKKKAVEGIAVFSSLGYLREQPRVKYEAQKLVLLKMTTA